MAVTKLVMLLVAIGLCLTAGSFLLSGQYFGSSVEHAATLTIAVTPAPPATEVETTGSLPSPIPQNVPPATPVKANQKSDPAAPAAGAGAGAILVSKRPIEVLAGPSSSTSVLYGFPAGRPFRVIGHSDGFARIQDLQSGAAGWIDEAALAPPPRVRRPIAAATPKSKPAKRKRKPAAASVNPKPVAAKKSKPAPAETETAASEPEPVYKRKRRGLFGFRRNGGDGGLGGFAFGRR